jgi:type VI secretion system protein ImpE
LKQGDIEGALAALQDRVRKAPDDPRLRVFLFQLLCVLGNWSRAIGQLKTCATLSPAMNDMAQMYRTAILGERQRERVFLGEADPVVLGEPADWMAWMIEALKLQIRGHDAAAADLRARAFDAAPAAAGTLNGEAFSWVADADSRLGPVLELIVNGRYVWAPFTALHRLQLEAPVDLRDRVWMPATVTWSNGGEAIVLIPTRYAGTTESRDNQLRLAGATQWEGAQGEGAQGEGAQGEGVQGDGNSSLLTKGIGQRVLATDRVDCALMDLRELVIGDQPVVFDAAPVDGADHG